MLIFNVSKTGTRLAMAIALATGVTTIAPIGVSVAASAQESSDPVYSEAYVQAYVPLDAAAKAEPADWNAVAAGLPALANLTFSQDEQLATGNLTYNAGVRTDNDDLKLRGMKLILESGKVAPEQLGRFNFIAYELLRTRGMHAESRSYLQVAIDNNFTFQNVDAVALQDYLARSFGLAGDHKGGVQSLLSSIDSFEAQGAKADPRLYTSAISMAYNNEVVPEIYSVIAKWIGAYPTETNWRDAVNITRNINQFNDAENLDILRLGHQLKILDRAEDYLSFIDAADPRRLPGEVKLVIEQGYATGIVDRSDTFVSESLATANSRIASDRRELPALESDAGAAGASLRTVMAAGDAFYSYGEYVKAAGFYEKALTLPGADVARINNRLGMSQVALGQFAEAQATLAKVTGRRAPIANLWSIYAAAQQNSATTVPTTAGS